MYREAMVDQPIAETLLLLERGVTALSSAFNGLYFAAYRAATPRRRLGTLALVLVNLAFLVQSLYFGLLPYLIGGSPLGLPSEAKLGWVVAAFPLAATTLITLLVLRQMTARRRR